MRETPYEWEGRNKAQFLKSTKEALGKEMWFAVKINVIGTFLFMIGIILGVAVNARWAYGIMAATGLAFGVTLYWAWYIRRSQNRRWEKELAANAFMAKKAETEVNRPPDDLLTKGRVERQGYGQIESGPDGPRRSFGG